MATGISTTLGAGAGLGGAGLGGGGFFGVGGGGTGGGGVGAGGVGAAAGGSGVTNTATTEGGSTTFCGAGVIQCVAKYKAPKCAPATPKATKPKVSGLALLSKSSDTDME